MGSCRPDEKSLKVTYFLWLFLGFFGVHHFYLGRDSQAFIWWCTLGGYLGCGWVRDLFYIPRYVAEANNDPDYVKRYNVLLKSYSAFMFYLLGGPTKVIKNNRLCHNELNQVKWLKDPPFSVARFAGMLVVGYLFAALLQYAIPEEPVLGINWYFLHYLVPLACAFGVWLVGNVGREQGKIWWCLAAAYAAYPFSVYFEDETTWFTLMVLSSTMAFDNMSKEWRREPRKKQPLSRRLALLGVGVVIYLSLWASNIYFNGELTNSEGEKIPFKEAIHHFFTSPWWVDLKQSLYDVYTFAQHHGWYEVWKQIVDLSDPHGEINAYKVLGVDSSASQAEITSKWRTLSREFHPDKVKDPDKKQEAQNKFMEIQQAYEILSKIKMRRKNKNQQSTKN